MSLVMTLSCTASR